MALRAGYLALTRNVSLLGQHRVKFKDLLKSIFMFRFDWLVDSHEHTGKLFESYQKLLLNLLSSNSCFVPPVCRTLVMALTLKEEIEEETTTSKKKKKSKKKKEQNEKSNERVCEQVRNTIVHMIKVAPSSQKSLQHALRECFPHATKSVESISYYITNLLRLSDSIPLMREFVFCLIVEKIIKIDVMVSRFDTEEEEEEEDEKKEEEETSNDAEKLDRIMCLVFEFLKREMTKKTPKQDKDEEDKNEEEETTRSRGWSEVSDMSDRDTTTTKDDDCKDMFMTALRAFRTTVIHTHQSTCIQFIVFYAAQFDESLPSTFVGLLLDALANESLSEALRMTCVCYCASFVSRAKYIELGTVRAALSFLAFWLRDYIEKRTNDTDYENNSTDEKKEEESITTSGLYVTRRDHVQKNEHNIFYCSLQALLYTLCFKTKSILSEPDGIAFLQDLNLTAILSCSLNPLSRCLRDVALEFQSLAVHVGWSSTLVEFLKHVVLTTESKNEEDEEKDEEKKSIAFDEFFPFDPYLLPKSGEMYVTQGIYNKWDESAIKVDDDEEEEEEEENAEEGVVDKEEQEREHERYRQRLLRVGLGT